MMLDWLELKLRLGAELDASDGKTLLVRAVTGGAFGDWCRTQNVAGTWKVDNMMTTVGYGKGFQNSTKCLAQILLVCSVSSERNLTFGTSICINSLDPPSRVSVFLLIL